MKITGKLVKILELQKGVSKAGKNWQKQSFVLDTGAEFNNEICIDTFGEKIEQIQNLKNGAEIEVKLNVSSKEYNGRYYHNISAWEITLQDSGNIEESDNMPF
tara:strand:- start:206 stop:514 length:309 start_codon:yes stop_codon:yes gene_type:complete